MSHIELSAQVFDDFDRFFDHLSTYEVDNIPARIGEITQALQILVHSPLIGRRTRDNKRELVIGQGSDGYVALYQFIPTLDIVFVLAIRSQRESGFKQGP
jgi:toxin ParE1/3/4